MMTIDAKNKTLGRVASAAAKALLGKHSADFARHKVADVEVKIINASQIVVTGDKAKAKEYIRYTGYPGGLRTERYDMLTSRRGHGEAIRRAVKGMLPKNRLQDPRLKKLVIEN